MSLTLFCPFVQSKISQSDRIQKKIKKFIARYACRNADLNKYSNQRYIKIRVRYRALGEIKQKKSSRGSPMNNSLVLLYPMRHSAKPEFWYVEIGLFDTSCGTDERIQLSNSKFINVTLGVRLACNLGNSLWDSNAVFIIFFNFCVLSSNSASFSRIACSFPCPPYTMLNLWKPSEYKLPTLFEGWSEGLGMCQLKKAPQIQICPKIFFFRIIAWL